jgi:hypothetical protein
MSRETTRPRTPAFLKPLLASERLRNALCYVASLYIRFVHVTSRWTILGEEAPRAMWGAGKPFILAFWHGRLLMMPYCWRTPMRMNMLISQHRDGALIANTIARFGLRSVRGSQGNPAKGGAKLVKGGASALRAMAKLAKTGEALGITPDGPRGPRMRASEGIVALARLTGLPVIPATYATSNRRILGSWDKFVLALPFSRGVIVWGRPIQVARDGEAVTAEQSRRDIEQELNRITSEADRLAGVPSVEPAPARASANLLEAMS